MEREFSDSTVLVGGYFVDTATATVQEAEAEAQDLMLRAMSDDMEYWGRISSAVLHDDSQAEHVKNSVAPEFQSFAQMWTRTGRSLDVIKSLKDHANLMQSRFDPRGRGGCDAKHLRRGCRSFPSPNNRRRVSVRAGRLRRHSSPRDWHRRDADDGQGVRPHVALLQARDVQAGVWVQRTRPQAASFGVWPVCSFVLCKRRGPVDLSPQGPVDGGLEKSREIRSRIYEDLVNVKFSGNPNAYQGNVGLNLMREVTGNVVDLDTTVLRCSCKATLNAINASNAHKKEKTYASVDEFAKSAQAMEIAIHCSIPLLDTFAAAVGIKTEAEKVQRAIDSSKIKRPIPVASNNTDRGVHPVWHYVNAGQNSFHCNVPNLDDVNGALLRAPYRCAKIWATLVSLYRSDPAELHKRMLDFFENCVVDSCFNMKWKAIEEFESKMQHEGTIVDVLQREQMNSQKLFTVEFFDADDEQHTKEVDLMYSLVAGRVAISAKDARKRALREITREDVALWVEDPAVVL
ncbi:Hypothetical protein, putative [Bodo saltans]|uniref:Uncharacterized protein n=1 Tax=Bodo saltans TaxID=75058 RepID=A0A0S4JGX7_BODSA|nr:Hypothetical protein, putative [Bodo saltans]|eukprot:CUG89358.1 Hypothetical protein, putative [Bodo saltans]